MIQSRYLSKAISFLFVLVLFMGVNACSKTTSAHENVEKKEAVANFILDPFILNIANHGQPRFLKIAFALELANGSFEERAKARTAQLRDAIIALVSARSSDDFLGQDGKIQLKDEILLQANQILKDGAVKNIYFTDIVMQ
ncbi:MAG: flagellar basal body-associated FliL family protein [Nitrospirae bacterium]|nr:flagellar basal body-associated FliL family protein [Nitrospirota bacterium]